MDATFSAAMSGFTFVAQLWLVPDLERGESHLTLQMASDAELRRRRTFVFENVSNLRIESLGSGVLQIMGLRVTDLPEPQPDGIRYQVSDAESGGISFACRDIACQDEG